MATQDDVRRIALSLPGATERDDGFVFVVDGKSFAWPWMERVHPKRARIASTETIAVRLAASATQTGPFLGMPPSGKRYSIDEIHIFRVRDGRIVEHWHQYDQLGLMQQLGAMPAQRGGRSG